MKKQLPPEVEFYPPFEGFPREGIAFLKKLKKNNTRPWFQQHKQEYEDFVRFPMQCLVASLRERMAGIAPEIVFNPKSSLFRVYRDVRFSRNKAPYKTNIAASFEVRNTGRSPVEMPGLYIGIEPGAIFVGGGLYMPAPLQLKTIRKAMTKDSAGFLEIINARRFKSQFGGVQGEKLSRAPLGYPADHPIIEHLKLKQFYVGKEYEDESACYHTSFLTRIVRVFSDTIPFVRWLSTALAGKGR